MKIEYDQRFFNDGYAEFQVMISDIRKQIKLNKEVIALRNELKEVYSGLQDDKDKTAQKKLIKLNQKSNEVRLDIKNKYLKKFDQLN